MVCATTERYASIAGGFVSVPVGALVASWRACRTRPLGTADFRAWLALREMVARRACLTPGRAPAYGPAELAGLLGVSERRARAAVNRLVDAGLVEWSTDAIVFPDHFRDLTKMVGGLEDTIGGGQGSVAIPRRMLRHLARGARPAMIAAALGALLRCLSHRRSGWSGRGRFKASWIASTFGVDLRRVKQARAELVALGWLAPEPSDQRAENRWGRAYRIDLGWERPRPDRRELPPLPPPIRPAIATPSVDPDPLPEREENQEPAERGPAGASLGGPGEKQAPAPNLDDVRPEDLCDVGRALELHRQAVDRGLADPSEAGRLRFLALAEHARAVGKVNPGGLFAALLRRGAWAFATALEEDVARRRLRDHLHGTPRTPAPQPERRRTFVPDSPAAGPSSLAAVLSRCGAAGITGGAIVAFMAGIAT